VRRETRGTDDGLISDATRLEEIAAIVVPRLKLRHGRRTRLASLAHERVLGMLAEMGKSTVYTWCESEEDFTDAATLATRRQFADSKFDPRPACRRRVRSERAARSSQGSERAERSCNLWSAGPIEKMS
jgi:hypothetical protein